MWKKHKTPVGLVWLSMIMHSSRTKHICPSQMGGMRAVGQMQAVSPCFFVSSPVHCLSQTWRDVGQSRSCVEGWKWVGHQKEHFLLCTPRLESYLLWKSPLPPFSPPSTFSHTLYEISSKFTFSNLIWYNGS